MKINLTNKNAIGSVVLGSGTPIAGATGPQGAQGVQGSPGAPGGPQGNQGFQGFQGVQGAQGRQGVQGSPGAQGSSGIQGDQGSQGSQGHQGVQGAQGIPGTFAGIGAQGVQGDSGVKGDKGDTGAQGLTGDKGNKGDSGAQGIQGAAGSKGDAGAQGVQGSAGAAGIAGDKGDTGAQGIAGNKGDKGDTGAQGAAGTAGAQGIQGAAGDKGETGAQGAKGDDSFVPGPAGEQGVAGSKGDKGEVGAQGVQGAAGYVGSDGAQGAQGVAGSKGDKGDMGAQGAKGDDVNSIAAFNQANAAYDQANTAYDQANNAFDQANAAYTQANNAYDDANTRVLKAGDTMTGNLNVAATIISQNIVPDLDVTYDLGTPEKRFRDLYLSGTTLFLGNTQVSTTGDDEISISSLTANTINLAGYNVQTWISETTERANLKVATIEGSLLSVNTSNTSNVVVANITIREANTTQTGVVQLYNFLDSNSNTLAATANTVYELDQYITSVEELATDAIDQTDALRTYVNNVLSPTSNIAANTVRVSANGGSTLSKQQLNFVNTADLLVSVGAGAGAASGNANVGFTLQTTGVAAGTYGDASNVATVTVDSKGRITSVSNVAISTISGDLTVSGNLSVLGDSTVLNVSMIKVEDNEIILNSNVTGEPLLNALLTVNRGANTNVSIRWNESSDNWEWTDDGSTYYSFAEILLGNAQAADAYNQANGAYNAANDALILAGDAHDQGNSAYDQANSAYDAANTANVTPIQVDGASIGDRRIIDFQSANTSNLTISGTDDPTNNKVILLFDNPKLGGGGVYANTELYVSDVAPTSANSNVALWWRANTGKFYIYYDDGSSSQWVSLTPTPVVNISSELSFIDSNTAASIAIANTLNSTKANRSGDTFTGNVSVFQNSTKLNVSSTLIESNGRLTINATEYKVNTITLSANSGATSLVAQTVVDLLPISEYRTVKYLVQIKSGANYQATEILLLHNGTTVHMTEYATVTTGSYLGGFSSDINSGQMRLLFDPVFAVNTLNISRISMPV